MDNDELRNYINFAADTKRFKRMTQVYDEVKYRCKCGHRVIISKGETKALCDWCHNYVFINKQEEFKYRVKEKMGKK